MEKERNGKMIAIAALLISIIGLSVGFASLSTVLTINGTGRVQTSNWDVHFENLGGPTLTGTAAIGAEEPVLTDTTFGDFDVTFTSPKDSITYTFDVENTGSYDAEISAISIPTPSCNVDGDTTAESAVNVCKYLTYTLKYANGDDVEVGDTLAKTNGKESLVLTLAYGSPSAAELATENVSIDNLQITMTYKQAGVTE